MGKFLYCIFWCFFFLFNGAYYSVKEVIDEVHAMWFVNLFAILGITALIIGILFWIEHIKKQENEIDFYKEEK